MWQCTAVTIIVVWSQRFKITSSGFLLEHLAREVNMFDAWKFKSNPALCLKCILIKQQLTIVLQSIVFHHIISLFYRRPSQIHVLRRLFDKQKAHLSACYLPCLCLSVYLFIYLLAKCNRITKLNHYSLIHFILILFCLHNKLYIIHP